MVCRSKQRKRGKSVNLGSAESKKDGTACKTKFHVKEKEEEVIIYIAEFKQVVTVIKF